MKKLKMVFGVAINDADYAVNPTVSGKRALCPFYMVWKSMLSRCYSLKYLEKYPTYIGCSVAPEWHLFSNFKAWMETQDWQGKQLDKDILIPGNKIYSPETCVFVSSQLNAFLTDSGGIRGKHLIGAYWDKKSKKYSSRCNNPFNRKYDHLGYFTDEMEAHHAWLSRKHELACQYADLQTDLRIAKALRERFTEQADTGVQELENAA